MRLSQQRQDPEHLLAGDRARVRRARRQQQADLVYGQFRWFGRLGVAAQQRRAQALPRG